MQKSRAFVKRPLCSHFLIIVQLVWFFSLVMLPFWQRLRFHFDSAAVVILRALFPPKRWHFSSALVCHDAMAIHSAIPSPFHVTLCQVL